MATKVEKIGNYIVLTDLVTSVIDDYSSDDVYFNQSSGTIFFYHKFNRALIHQYLWTELRDSDELAWSDLPTLLNWLRKHTGDAGYASDYFLEVSAGEIDGVSHINKFGANIDIAADTIHYAIMTAGNNQSLMSIYTIPRGKRGYLTNYYCTVIDAANKTPTSTVFKLWAADRFNNYEFQLKHAVGIPSRGNMTEHVFMPYGSAGQMTDIKITALPADQPANVASGFGIILVDD